MARKARITKKLVKDNIEGTMGIMWQLAQKCGCDRAYMSTFMNKPENSDLLELMHTERLKLVELAEIKLVKRINEGNDRLIMFTLTSLGKDKGWVPKSEVEQSGHTTSTVRIAEIAKIVKELEKEGY